jgi:hypothetical protein
LVVVAFVLLAPFAPQVKAGIAKIGLDRHAHLHPGIAVTGWNEMQGFPGAVKAIHAAPTLPVIKTYSPGASHGSDA